MNDKQPGWLSALDELAKDAADEPLDRQFVGSRTEVFQQVLHDHWPQIRAAVIGHDPMKVREVLEVLLACHVFLTETPDDADNLSWERTRRNLASRVAALLPQNYLPGDKNVG